MRSIRAILDGTREASVLTEFRDVRSQASAETITQALEGNYCPEYLLALRQAVALYDTYQRHVAEYDQHIEAPLPTPRRQTRQR